MALQAGRTLGQYQILSSLGAGGMGEVYRARDTRLGREVAIKLILAEVARDAERLSRFEREARVLASLNHPRIATLHGFESEGDTRFLVMELVEGETLADRIARGPLPVDEAVALFLQIAEGLEAAHEKGVVHRDLKPANVKVSEGGGSGARVKILDFGLAKAMAPADTAHGSDPSLSASPTMTLAATMRGEILGTAAYMSPEQAAGNVVDKRADIWAFGVCLYEALTGRRPFHGDDAANTLASVLRDPIDFDALPAGCPPRLRGVIERCLVRDARNRLRDIGDARVEMQALASDAGRTGGPAVPDSSTTSRRAWGWLFAGLVAGAVLSFGLQTLLRSSREAPATRNRPVVSRSTIDLADLRPDPILTHGVVTMSPDGSLLLLAAGVVRSRLYARRLDSLTMAPLAGTDRAWSRVSFSPDGEWLAYWTLDGTLWKLPLDGGPSIRLAAALDYWGGSWDRDGTLVYAPDTGSGLYRLPAAGGEPESVTRVDTAAGEMSHRFPAVLPDGKGVIFSVKRGDGPGDWRIVALSSETKSLVPLVEGGIDGRYAPTGHLIYGRDGSLYAAPMDLDPPRILGSAELVVEGVVMAAESGIVSYSFSDDGTLAYVPEAARAALLTPLVWVDREGRREVLSGERRNFTDPRLSPSGSSLAVAVAEGGRSDIYVYDLERGVASRLTTAGNNLSPVWTPDGERIVFQSSRTGNLDLYWQRADGSGEAEPLTGDATSEFPTSMSPDGALAYTRPGSLLDIWTLRPGSGEEPAPFLATADDEANPVFSPDGKWIAYELLQGNRPEIFVVPYPAGGRRIKISIDGGVSPVWSRSSQELFYMERGERMMGVAYEVVGTEFRPGVPRPLFEARTRMTGMPTQLFDVTPDGRRFVMPEAALSKAKVVLVQNWFEELKRLVPTARD